MGSPTLLKSICTLLVTFSSLGSLLNATDPTTVTTTAAPAGPGAVDCQLKDASDKYTFFKVNFRASFNISYETTEPQSEIQGVVNEFGTTENKTYAYAHVNVPTINGCSAHSVNGDDGCTQINATFSWTPEDPEGIENESAPMWNLTLVYEVEKAPKKGNLCSYKDQDDWDSFDYWLKGIQFEYYIEDTYFVNAAQPGKAMSENWGLDLYEVDSDSSYKCDSNSSVKIDDDVTLYFKDFQSQAFQFEESDKTESSYDTAKLCSADDDGSSLVPIIVGCVLAGLIILTLVAYFIGRWHQNRQESYQAL